MEQTTKKIIIAIDGFSSCGKSTFAKAIAARLGYIFIDTGAMYRAVTLCALEQGAITAEAVDVEKVVSLLPEINISFRFNAERGASDVYVNGECVEHKIRSIEVSNAVSRISSIGAVREKLVAMQQQMGCQKGVVMDGRDIGTVVLPDAELKLFLAAKPEVRAQRRVLQLAEKGIEANYDDVLADVIQRDYNDSHRDFRPLKLAEDGILIDNTELPLDETVEKIISLAKERMA